MELPDRDGWYSFKSRHPIFPDIKATAVIIRDGTVWRERTDGLVGWIEVKSKDGIWTCLNHDLQKIPDNVGLEYVDGVRIHVMILQMEKSSPRLTPSGHRELRLHVRDTITGKSKPEVLESLNQRLREFIAKEKKP